MEEVTLNLIPTLAKNPTLLILVTSIFALFFGSFIYSFIFKIFFGGVNSKW